MTNTQIPPYPAPSPPTQAENNLRWALNQIEEALADLPDVTEVSITATPHAAITLDGTQVRRGWRVKAELSTSRQV